MVVGETSRALNWQLYGYERETNPLLVQQSGLVAFPKVLTESNTTHKKCAYVIVLTLLLAVMTLFTIWKGIITAFKEAGFRTAFFSNQRFNHSFIDFFGREADTFDFIKEDSLDFSYNPSDNELLKLVEQELAKGAKNNLSSFTPMVLISTIGNVIRRETLSLHRTIRLRRKGNFGIIW